MGNAATAKPLIPLKPNGMDSVLNPQLAKDLEAIEMAQMELNSIRQKIKKLAAMLHAGGDALRKIQEIMGLVANESGAQVNGASDVANLDSDIRSEVGAAQSSYNTASNVTNGTKVSKNVPAMKKLMAILNGLQAFINDQEGKGKNAVADSASLKNLQGAINSIKDTFGKDWGDPTKMAEALKAWNMDAHNHGDYSPQLKKIEDGFNTANQTVSGLSTASNTRLNFVVEQYKQWLGMLQSDNQLILKTQNAAVSNQRQG